MKVENFGSTYRNAQSGGTIGYECSREEKTLSDTLNYLGRIYELTAKPIFKDDHLEYILGIVRDITEEYVAKKELKKVKLSTEA